MPGFRQLEKSNLSFIEKIVILFLISNALCFAQEKAIVDYHDTVRVNKTLTLSQLISQTVEKFPDHLVSESLEQEADALQQRGNSLLAGASTISLHYQDDLAGDDIGYRETEAEVELPLWNWGQRAAGRQLAEQAKIALETQLPLIQLKVAGLVRRSLWDVALIRIRSTHAQSILDISEKQLNNIKRRVELGDLARTDLLLAQSDHLQKRSLLIRAKAEWNRVHQNYISLTGIKEIPQNFTEQQSLVSEINDDHPQLAAINALVQRRQAEVDWVTSAGSGQSSFTIGGKSEREDKRGDDIESMGVEISIPFGGSAHLAPDIAAANLELTEALAERVRIFRQLTRELQQAKNALKVSQLELQIANELNKIADSQLKMTQLSFSEGEINLMDLLKIQAHSYHAIRLAKENKTMLEKNIALYNQAVGVQP